MTAFRLLEKMRDAGFTQQILDDLVDHPELLRDFLGYYRVVRGESQIEDSMMILLSQEIRDLPLSVRTLTSLSNHGLRRVFHLVQLRKDDLLRVRNFGKRSLQEIADFLVSNGLNLSMKFEMRDELPIRVINPGTPPVFR